MKIPYTKPSITKIEQDFVENAISVGWGDRCYEYLTRFEQDFARHLQIKHVVATSSCTGALHLGLAALGIGVGDEVILADTNWVATVSPIIHLGAQPVLVDIDPETWCIDPIKVEEAITNRTKAIIATHLYGNVAKMDELIEIGLRHNVAVVEDAAEAIGSKLNNQHAGTMGSFGTFSFHGSKTITTGEGGAFVTNDDSLAELVRTLNNHGRSATESRQFWPERAGFKYRMSNVQAAIGCAQLTRIDELVGRKQEILNEYRNGLAENQYLTLNQDSPFTTSGAWMPNVVISKCRNKGFDELADVFKNAGVDARPFFAPLSNFPFVSKEPKLQNINSFDLWKRSINLPSFHDITKDEMSTVINLLNSEIK